MILCIDSSPFALKWWERLGHVYPLCSVSLSLLSAPELSPMSEADAPADMLLPRPGDMMQGRSNQDRVIIPCHSLNEQLLQGFHSPHGPLHFSLPTLLCANASLFHCFSPADTSLFRCPSSADASLFCCFSLVLGRGLPISLMLPLPAVMLNLLLLALFLLLGLRSCALLLSLSLKCNLLCRHFFHFND